MILQKRILLLSFLVSMPAYRVLNAHADQAGSWEQDVIETSRGNLTIHFIGHGTLMMEIGDLVLHIDPTMREADYETMPDADIILLTHEHGDHFDQEALGFVCDESTVIILPKKCAKDVPVPGDLRILNNGENASVQDISITAIPAYNLVHQRSGGMPYHPKGEGNGYVVGFGDTRVYVAGDTENIPEMKRLRDIDIAFLPMNLPYTMTPAMVADAARAFRPAILYPYHYGNTDVQELIALLRDEQDIDVRIRDMQ